MPTNLSIEQEEQRRWTLRPKYARVDWFDKMVTREFASPDEQGAWESLALGQIVRFAVDNVPYYRDLFKRLGMKAGDIRSAGDLPLLPVLTRSDVQDNVSALRAARLPPGQKFGGFTKTSGSTGQPVVVAQTTVSNWMFPLLAQRQMRWARFDPAGSLGSIRPARDLPRLPGGQHLGPGDTCRHPSWPMTGKYFETGPFSGLSNANPLDGQVEWVERERPNYLLMQSADMEHLALGFQDRPPVDSLRGFQAISQQLTPEMRRRIERTFGVPVHENYGLNEFGIVALRCMEGERYHVNTELCLVEVVDEEGQPCRAGEKGRIVVTTLTNAGMPLLRYDADDLAEAVEGPCPCGRTLPSFGAIHGRYRRITMVPPEALEYWHVLHGALTDMPADISKPLRQYQLHQFSDARFELRLVVAGTLSAGFVEWIESAWRTTGAPADQLTIRQVDEIPRPPGGKFQDMTSDFVRFPKFKSDDSG